MAVAEILVVVSSWMAAWRCLEMLEVQVAHFATAASYEVAAATAVDWLPWAWAALAVAECQQIGAAGAAFALTELAVGVEPLAVAVASYDSMNRSWAALAHRQTIDEVDLRATMDFGRPTDAQLPNRVVRPSSPS